MMPRAGGQYVYLREGLDRCGLSVRLDVVSGHPDGDHCRGGCGVRKFLGVFYPAISAKNWIWHVAHVPPFPGPMVLGNMDVGLSTQSLVAVLIVVTLSVINNFRCAHRRADPEHFYQLQNIRGWLGS